MALKIRLARGGTKKRPFYRIVVADVRAPRDGRFIEKLGTYNPLLPKDHETRVTLNEERIRHWLGVGAKPTDRVARFLSQADLFEWKPGNNPIKGRLRRKAQERLDEQREAEEAAKAEAEADAGEAEATESDEPAAEEAVAEESADAS